MTRVGAASPEEEIFRPQAPAGGRKIVWGGEYLLAARKAGRTPGLVLRGHGVEKFLGVVIGRIGAQHGFQVLAGFVAAA